MYPRTSYEMTKEDLDKILDASKPVMVIAFGGIGPSSPQENANRAWAALGRKMGFDSSTVSPIPGKGDTHFSAVPSETKEHKEARLKEEKEDKRIAEIDRLKLEISERQEQLDKLTAVKND